MTPRSIQTVGSASPQPGTGILRPFPSRRLPHIDPFVFLDTGTPKQLGAREIYVGPHPHRGVQPVSLLFRGRIEHRDSLGNHRSVRSGGMQWLVSGSGALHEEVLGGDGDGVFHMAQLWVNVPAALKLAPPEHHTVASDAVPRIDSLGDGATLRLYAGRVGGAVGPAPLPTPVLVAYVQITAGGRLEVPVPRDWNAAFTVVDGAVSCADTEPFGPGDTPVFSQDGDTLSIRSERGGELLLMCGRPIGEPIAMGGGFVMNSESEIAQAFDDYRSGRMGTLLASR